jgi:hypothetical protein
LYILSRETTQGALKDLSTTESRSKDLAYPVVRDGEPRNEGGSCNWPDIFLVRSPSELGGSVYDEELERRKDRPGGSDNGQRLEELPANEGWVFMDAITQDRITATVSERCAGLHIRSERTSDLSIPSQV